MTAISAAIIVTHEIFKLKCASVTITIPCYHECSSSSLQDTSTHISKMGKDGPKSFARFESSHASDDFNL